MSHLTSTSGGLARAGTRLIECALDRRCASSFQRDYSKSAPASRSASVLKHGASSVLGSGSTSALVRPERRLAFAFDIDGVLRRGEEVIPQAKRAVQLLRDGRANGTGRSIPSVFLTNSGGYLESSGAKRLTTQLEVPVEEAQMVLSHTPYSSISHLYRDKPVLVVGGRDIKNRSPVVHMNRYGFENVYTPSDLLAWRSSSWPFTNVTSLCPPSLIRRADFSQVHFAAVLVYHDSRDWGLDIQHTIDVLRSEGGVFGTEQRGKIEQAVPLWFSHNDLLWSNDFGVNRLGQGAFRCSLEQVWRMVTGTELQVNTFGKPEGAAYSFAAERLIQQLRASEEKEEASAERQGTSEQATQGLSAEDVTFWMIGDNPRSDIVGANRAGWSSALVRTGVFREDDPLTPREAEYQPTIVVDNVEDAVREAIQRHLASEG